MVTCCGCKHYIPLRRDTELFRCRSKNWNFYSTNICVDYERKPMSDKIEINVTVNDRPGTLADVSPETLMGLRDKAVPTIEPVKLTEHGDYGYHSPHNGSPRFFFRDEDTGKIKAYDTWGRCVSTDANRDNDCYPRDAYVATGNIFKDMREGKYDGS